MSTLRISNIEAKADSSSPTVDEQLKFTNSDGDLMLYLDGRTAGITTVGINTTNQTIKFDANNNVMVTGIITATEFHGSLAVGTSVTYGDNEKAYFGTGLDLELFHNGTNSVINNTEGALLFQNNGSSSMYIGSTGQVYLNNDITFVGASANALWDKSENYFSIPDKIVHSGDVNTAIRFPTADTFSVETAGTERLRITSTGQVKITGTDDQDNFIVDAAQTQFKIHQDSTDGEVSLRAEDGSGNNYAKYMTFFVEGGSGSTERVRINSTGQIITNGGSANPYPTRAATFQPPSGQTNCYVSIVSGSTSGVSGLTFGDGADNNAANYAGMFEYRHNGDTLAYMQNASDRLRIASDGDLTIVGSDNAELKLLCGSSSGNDIIAFQNSAGTTRGNITYDSDNNFLLFNVNQGERLRIDSNGRVVIGHTQASTNYGKLLHIHNSASAGASLHLTDSTTGTGNSDGFEIVTHSQAAYLVQRENNHMIFMTNGTNERLRITSAGVVQIGKDDQSSTTFTQDLDIRGRYVNAVGDFSRLMFRNSTNSGNSSSSIRARRSGNNYGTNLSLFTHYSTSSGGDGLERLRITPLGQFLQRQQAYSETYQTDNFGNAMYIKSGWLRFSSNFSNPTKDLVILADGGNANNSLYIKVTVMHLDYPGSDRGVGAISIGYASAKRAGDNSGKWHAEKSNMAIESGSNFHGAFSNVGALSWENSNTSDTNTLRYTSNRVANYDQYHVQVEVWQRGNCSYYLHSDYVE